MPQIDEMLKKLNELYDREEQLKIEYEQLQEQKELLQAMIMHTYNTLERKKEYENV